MTLDDAMYATAYSPSLSAFTGGLTPIPLKVGFTLPAITELAKYRGDMLRFARRKIRDADLAEDAVQDALISAMTGLASFQGQSALKTWLLGILNHKIQDIFRRESRYQSIADGEDSSAEETLERLAEGMGEHGEDPASVVARERMHVKLSMEIEALPESLRDVFKLQVLEGLDTEEVCQRLKISEANCWVRLHRARKRLSERMAGHLN
jgi:RNA polymerase sigma-70 factor, ECF subfamily